MAKITREKALESAKKYNDAQKARTVIPLLFLGGIGSIFGLLKLVGKKKYYWIPFLGFILGVVMMIVLLISFTSTTNTDMYNKVFVKYDEETKGVIATFEETEEKDPIVFKGYKDSQYNSDSGKLGYHSVTIDVVYIGKPAVITDKMTETAKNNAESSAIKAAKNAKDIYLYLYDGVNYENYTLINPRFIDKEGNIYTPEKLDEKYGYDVEPFNTFITSDTYSVIETADGYKIKASYKHSDSTDTLDFSAKIPNDYILRYIHLDYNDMKSFDQMFVFNGEEFENTGDFELLYNTTSKEFDIPQASDRYGNKFEDSNLYVHSSKYYTQRTITFIFIGLAIASYTAHLVLLIMQKNSANAYVTYVKKCSKSLDKDQREGFVNSMLDAARGNDLEKAAAILDEKGFDVQAASEEVATEVTEETTAE